MSSRDEHDSYGDYMPIIETCTDANEATDAVQAPIDMKRESDECISNITLNGSIANNCGDIRADTTAEVAAKLTPVASTAITKDKTNKINKKNITGDNKFKTTKRDGTSGVSGQLYESKLLSLVYLRASTNSDIRQLCLATNMNDIGDLDDLCIRFTQDGDNIMIFLQAKHKRDVDKGRIAKYDLYKDNGDFALPKYFKSYMDIRQKFDEKRKDVMFELQYEDMKCYFVLYTTAKDDLRDEKCVYGAEQPARSVEVNCLNASTKKQNFDKAVNDLICTGDNSLVFQYKYSKIDIDILSKTLLVKRLKQMGKKLFQIISECNVNKNTTKTRYENLMTDKAIRNFHIALAQKVIKVSKEISNGYRVGTFREEFLSSDDEILIELRTALYSEALKKKKIEPTSIDTNLRKIVCDPSPKNISKLIGNVLTYNNEINRIEVTNGSFKIDPSLQKHLPKLQKLHVTEADAKMAFEMAGANELQFGFKLPKTFGNCDLCLSENRGPKQMKKLFKTITTMLHNSTDRIIVIDKKGDIEDTVGNLLVYDEDSKYLMFNVDEESLENNAKILLAKLKTEIYDLDTYRLKINILECPRISFDTGEYERSFAEDFLNNLWFYTGQAKENEIEEITKKVISVHYNARTQNQALFCVRAEAIFLKLHHETQKWWMLESDKAYYLTNNDLQLFDNVVNYFIDCPLLSVFNFIYINKIKNTGIEFDTFPIELIFYDGKRPMIVETSVNILSCVKLFQHFIEHKISFKFLDLDYLLTFPQNNVDIAIEELTNINVDVVIVVYENTSNDEDWNKLERIIKKCDNKKVILVTQNLDEKLSGLIGKSFYRVKDKNNNYTDLTSAAQGIVLNTNITFQGARFSIVKCDKWKHLIKGDILLKIFNKDHINVGRAIFNSEYKEIKGFYVDRCPRSKGTVSSSRSYQTDEQTPGPSSATYYSPLSKKMRLPSYVSDVDKNTFKSLINYGNVNVIVAEAGMGKSTLLTHLSIVTKETNPDVWIQRINLIDYKRQFLKWRLDNVKIGTKQTLKFVCETALIKNTPTGDDFVTRDQKIKFDIDFIDNKLVLKTSENMNVLNSFELDLFIHSYNANNVIFIFDGLDDVHPQFSHEVFTMVKHIKNTISKSVWIASRPCDGINGVPNIEELLRNEFGPKYSLYTLERCTSDQEICYYELFFEQNIILQELNAEQFKNVDSLFEHVHRFIEGDPEPVCEGLHLIHAVAVEYFKTELKSTHLTPDKAHYMNKWNTEPLQLKDLVTSGIPRHMHFLANYFRRNIKDPQTTEDTLKWELRSSILYAESAEARIFSKEQHPQPSEGTDIGTHFQELKIHSAPNAAAICDKSGEFFEQRPE